MIEIIVVGVVSFYLGAIYGAFRLKKKMIIKIENNLEKDLRTSASSEDCMFHQTSTINTNLTPEELNRLTEDVIKYSEAYVEAIKEKQTESR